MKQARPEMFHGEQSQSVPRWVVHDVPGVVAIGGHRRGVPALVEPVLAAHLVQHKGFRYTTAPAVPAAPDMIEEN